MKKIYFSSWVSLLLILSQNLFSQNACPGPNPPVVKNYTYFINGQQVCALYIENMIPNAPVTLFGPGLTVIPTASGTSVKTDGTGFACYIFPCNQTLVRVTTCTINGCCNALVPAAAMLPVRLTKFVGKVNTDKSVDLDWSSVVEISSNKYVVEKSIDGKNFTAIGELNAAGNSARSIDYHFNDKSPVSGNSFYRLKQVDNDEKFEYSKVVYVNRGTEKGKINSLFPNPFKNEIQLVGINSAELNRKNVRLFNTTGQEVEYKISGANAISIGAYNRPGIYILKVNDQSFKLIKE